MSALRAEDCPVIGTANPTHDHQDSQDSQGNTKTIRESISLPLMDYLKGVLESLESSDAPEYPRWHSPLFSFTRLVRAHPEITDLRETEALAAVERNLASILRERKESAGKDLWSAFFSVEREDEARMDFMRSWRAVRHIPFRDLLENAARIAQERPFHPPVDRTPLYARFLSLAYWLQQMMGDKPILLPVRKIDSILGCHFTTVSILRYFAVQDRLLEKVKEFQFRSMKRGRATEFRFVGELRRGNHDANND